uniref:Small ribosomal subunit protein uS7c n=1 Tax=Chromochloris zofingiensis TaxID=31302 RepID=A0A140HA47_9CHLO|nr:ribosomal protein S7 [Chromochloris zofingiensis]AMO01046.1 ribosomal protein S7 [Chromochloris zofingiensis]
MPRRPIKKKRTLLPDPVYNSVSVHMLVNRVMESGKKSLAYRIVYNTLKEIGDVTQKNPVEVFEIALENVMPKVEVKPRRRAGSVQMVPRVLRSPERGQANALRWMLEACEKKSNKSMSTKLQTEILDAYEKKGNALKKKEELHKLAANNAMYAKRPQVILTAVGQTST